MNLLFRKFIILFQAILRNFILKNWFYLLHIHLINQIGFYLNIILYFQLILKMVLLKKKFSIEKQIILHAFISFYSESPALKKNYY